MMWPTLLLLSLFACLGCGHEADSVKAIYCRHCGAFIGTTEDILHDDEVAQVEPYVHESATKPTETVNLRRMRNGHALRKDANTLQNEVFESRRVTCTRCTRRLGWKYMSSCGGEEELGQDTAKEGEVDTEGRSLDWAFSTLEENCLYKNVDGVAYRYCHKESVTNRGKKEVSLGHFDKAGTDEERKKKNKVMFGQMGYTYVPFMYTGGDKCSGKLSWSKYETKVLLLCCDSFTEGDINAAVGEGEDENLRIELVLRKSICSFEMFICVPRLCFLPGYEHPETLENDPKPTQDTVHKPSASPKQQSCSHRTFFSLLRENVLIEGSSEYIWISALKADSLTV